MTTYNTTVLADSPVLYFPADGVTNGGSGSDTTWTATRSPNNTWTTGIGGVANGASVFNGSSTYIEYTKASVVSMFNGGTWSVELWFKKANTTDALAYRELFNCYDASNVNQVAIYGDDSTGHVALWYNFKGAARTKLTGPLINDTNWHHAVATSDGTTVRFYVDSVLVGTTGVASTGTQATGTPIWIGAYGTGTNSENWNGAIDEVAVWNNLALSQTRVNAHYTAGGGVLPNVTVAAPVMVMNPLSAVAPPFVGQPVDNTVSAPVMTLSMADPTPVVNGGTKVTGATGGGTEWGTGTAEYYFGETYQTAAIQFPAISIPTGKRIASATLTLSVDNHLQSLGAASTINFAVDRFTSAFTTQGAGTVSTTEEVTGVIVPTSNPSVDITNIAKAWGSGQANDGIQVNFRPGGAANSATYVLLSAHGSTISALFEDIPPQPVTVIAPPMTMSMSDPTPTDVAGVGPTELVTPFTGTMTMVAPRVTAGVSTSQSVPAIDAGSTDAVAPVVSVSGNITLSATPMVLSLTDVDASVAISNPDYTGTASPITLSLTMPTVRQYVEVNANVVIPAMYFGNLENEPLTISTVTNIIAVAKPFSLTGLKMVGIYSELGDRYHNIIPSTIDADDVWYKLAESAGAKRATDSCIQTTQPQLAKQKEDGYYFGAPTFGIDGPQLRTAVRFDGVKDYLVAGPYTLDDSGTYNNNNNLFSGGMDLTVEFSIRTTQLNGTIFNAQGGQDGGLAAISPTIFPTPKINGNKIVLNNGYISIVNGYSLPKTFTAKTGFISDGQWHHVVLSLPNTANLSMTEYLDQFPSAFLMVDGKPTIVRKGSFGSNGYRWVPYAFMADADYAPQAGAVTGGKAVKGYLAGDLSEIVVRLNKYIDENTAESIYYEWSESMVVHPDPITVSLDMPKVTAKSNMKKMLAVYGLGWGYDGNTGFPIDTYMSSLSGLIVETIEGYDGFNDAYATSVRRADSSNSPSAEYYHPKAFRLNEEYMVYPVSIRGDYYIDRRGLSSIAGFLSPDASTDSSGYLVDDTTGLPRFINLQEDLAVDLADFDALTVVNYPWIDPNKGYDIGDFSSTFSSIWPIDGQLEQKNMGLTDIEWEEARDALRDSILEAAYNGVNLWIGEIHMAQHLGFIESYDRHSLGYELYGQNGDDLASLNATMANPRMLTDEHAQELDRQHLANAPQTNLYRDWLYHGVADPGVIGATLGAGGFYNTRGQVNGYRRVSALIPGLTDLPAFDKTPEQIEGVAWNGWLPNGDFDAYNIQKRPNGYQLGDYSATDIKDIKTGHGFGGRAATARSVVLSARPQGIVGTVVNKEVEGYWGPAQVMHDGGTWVPNPYADNAVTIAAEVGSIVRGRPIKGRAFMEFMETSLYPYYIMEDQDKMLWNGEYPPGGGQSSFWDFDTRRHKEVKIETMKQGIVFKKANDPGGQGITLVSTLTDYMVISNVLQTGHLHYGWHMRGLHWLTQTPVVDLNDTVAYASAITIPIILPKPVIATQKNTVAAAVPMVTFLEARVPGNYHGPDVAELALPMLLDLALSGLGSSNAVPPMELSLTGVAPRVVGDVDLVTVFVDSGTSITLFLKEDN